MVDGQSYGAVLMEYRGITHQCADVQEGGGDQLPGSRPGFSQIIRIHGVDGASSPATDRYRHIEQPQPVVGSQRNDRIAELAYVLLGRLLGRLASCQDQFLAPLRRNRVESRAAHLNIRSPFA